MECTIRNIATDEGVLVAHILTYPNGSLFVWLLSPETPFVDDFHTAVPSAFSSIPSVSTKVGEIESTGRSLALKLAKKLREPVIVSWNLDSDSPELIATVEASLFKEIKIIQANRSSCSPVIGA